MAAFAFMPLDVASLASAAGKLAYSAQTFLPGRGLTADNSSPADRLRQIFEAAQRGGPNDQQGSTGDVFGNRNPSNQLPRGSGVDGISDDQVAAGVDLYNRVVNPEGVRSVARALNNAGEWFDFQRVSFLLAGLGFLWIGMVYITKNATQSIKVDFEGGAEALQTRIAQKQEQVLDKALKPKKEKPPKRLRKAGKNAGDASRLPPFYFGNTIPGESKPT